MMANCALVQFYRRVSRLGANTGVNSAMHAHSPRFRGMLRPLAEDVPGPAQAPFIVRIGTYSPPSSGDAGGILVTLMITLDHTHPVNRHDSDFLTFAVVATTTLPVRARKQSRHLQEQRSLPINAVEVSALSVTATYCMNHYESSRRLNTCQESWHLNPREHPTSWRGGRQHLVDLVDAAFVQGKRPSAVTVRR
jgi:hypothetical protein